MNRFIAALIAVSVSILVLGCSSNGTDPSRSRGTTPKVAVDAAEGDDAGTLTADATSGQTKVATFAGGCFWGMEQLFREIPGVTRTEVGYTGGTVRNATYTHVKAGRSGHAEAVRVWFDASKVSYAELLGWFFRMHDPTTQDRQGNDRGTQYRSAVFYHSDAQRDAARAAIAAEERGSRWTDPIVTQIVPVGAWWTAEPFHQDYLVRNPDGYTCHWLRD